MTRNSNILDDILTIDEYARRRIEKFDEQIASDLFVSYTTLERWKLKNGVRRYHVNAKRNAIITEMLNNGYNIVQISNRLNITVRQCYNIINQFKVVN